MLGSGDDHPISMVESETKTKSNIFKPPTTIAFIDSQNFPCDTVTHGLISGFWPWSHLVSGNQGVYRRLPIFWAHFWTEPTMAPWFRGGMIDDGSDKG